MTLLIFFIILSVLVLVHELGHFLVAKKSGVRVEEFGFGLPPRVWGKKIGETIYSINWLPLGGFVRLYGEDGLEASEGEDKNDETGVMVKAERVEIETVTGEGEEVVEAEVTTVEGVVPHYDLGRTFFIQKKRVRLAVLSAGVVMNFLLGVALFGAIYSHLGIPTQTDVVKVVEVQEKSPAAAAGIKADEVVIAVENEAMQTTERFIEVTSQYKGQQMKLTLKDKAGGVRTITVVPRQNPPDGEGALGVVISDMEMRKFPWWQMPFRGAWVGLKEAAAWGVTIGSGLLHMVSRLVVAGEVPKDVAGPVGIFQLTGDVKRAGMLALMQFVGVLSVNLAVLNLLPLPALDGGRLAFLAIEAVTRKRVKPELERVIHAGGMIFLLGLMVLVTVNDVVRISGAGSIIGLVRKVWPF